MPENKITIEEFIKKLTDWNTASLEKQVQEKWKKANDRRKEKGKAENKEKPQITNIYAGNEGKIRCKDLCFYLNKMQKLNPSRLFVGEAPGINGCFGTGISFTDINTLVNNCFFQDRNEKGDPIIDLYTNDEDKIEELGCLIIDYYFDKKTKEKIELIDFLKNEKIEVEKKEIKIKLAYLIIESLMREKIDSEQEEIKELKRRIKLAYSIVNFCAKDNVVISEVPEKTSSVVWKCLNKLTEKNLKFPLLWNIYPFQPLEADKEKKNRTPKRIECDVGMEFLFDLLKLFNIKEVYPVGKHAERTLKKSLEKEFPGIKLMESLCHPAARNGGATKFRKRFNDIYQIESEESEK